jgi:hypothetical protein
MRRNYILDLFSEKKTKFKDNFGQKSNFLTIPPKEAFTTFLNNFEILKKSRRLYLNIG